MSSPLEQGLAEVNWHDTSARYANDTLLRYHEGFGNVLNQEIVPEDIVIGGLGVKAAVDRDPPTYSVDPPRGVTVDLEHWAMLDDSVVRVAQRFSGNVRRNETELLARQVRARYDWIPGVARHRLKAVTNMVGRSTMFYIAVFDADTTVPDDEALRTMRAQAQGKERGDGLRHSIALGYMRSRLPIDRRQVSDRVAHRIDELIATEQGATTDTTSELVRQAAQSDVDERLGRMNQDRFVCKFAMEALLLGRRIRPSQPQHDI